MIVNQNRGIKEAHLSSIMQHSVHILIAIVFLHIVLMGKFVGIAIVI